MSCAGGIYVTGPCIFITFQVYIPGITVPVRTGYDMYHTHLTKILYICRTRIVLDTCNTWYLAHDTTEAREKGLMMRAFGCAVARDARRCFLARTYHTALAAEQQQLCGSDIIHRSTGSTTYVVVFFLVLPCRYIAEPVLHGDIMDHGFIKPEKQCCAGCVVCCVCVFRVV